MVGTATSSSSNSSCASFSSLEDISVKSNDTSVKFVCNYGGKILPHYHDGKLRYFGGDRRIISVDRSITYSELLEKLLELCGYETVALRCQLPNEDLDALITIKSDEGIFVIRGSKSRNSILSVGSSSCKRIKEGFLHLFGWRPITFQAAIIR